VDRHRTPWFATGLWWDCGGRSGLPTLGSVHSAGPLDPDGNVLATPALSSVIFERLGRNSRIHLYPLTMSSRCRIANDYDHRGQQDVPTRAHVKG
jgi:hypothetical protein